MIFCAWISLSLEYLGAEKRRNSNSWVSSCDFCGSSCSGCTSASADADALGVRVGFEGAGSVEGIGIGPYRAARRECSADSRVGSAAGPGEEDGEREV